MEYLLIGALGWLFYSAWNKHEIAIGNAPSPTPSAGVPMTPILPPSSGDITMFVQTDQGVKFSDAARAILAPLLQNFVVSVLGVFPGEMSISRPLSVTSDGSVQVTSLLQSQLGTDVWIQSNALTVAAGGGTTPITLQFEFPHILPQTNLTSSIPPAKSVADALSNHTVLVLLRTADETGVSS